MRIQHLVIGLVATGLLAAGAHGARAASSGAQKPLGKMTCEDFLALDETVQPKAVIYAVAYAKGGKPEAAIVDIEDDRHDYAAGDRGVQGEAEGVLLGQGQGRSEEAEGQDVV